MFSFETNPLYYIGLVRELVGFLMFCVLMYPILHGRDNIDPEDEDETIETVSTQTGTENVGKLEESERTHIQ